MKVSVILVVDLVLVVKQLLKSWHLLSLHLSVLIFVPEQKTNPTKNPTTLTVAFFPGDTLRGFVFHFSLLHYEFAFQAIKVFLCTMVAKYALSS